MNGPGVSSARSYFCSKCQERFRHPVGRCSRCGCGVIVRELRDGPAELAPVPLSEVKVKAEEERATSGVRCLDALLGGGLPHGYSVLVSADGGLGKSTLLLEAACRSGLRSLYATSEEDSLKVAGRARRLELPVEHASSYRIERGEDLLSALERSVYDLAVLDSVQATSFMGAPPGHVQASLALVKALHDWATHTPG